MKGPVPECLDVIKINGKWAQIVATTSDGKIRINWLDGTGLDEIRVEDFSTVRYGGITVEDAEEDLSDAELARLHWGEDSDQKLEMLLRVFGELMAKSE